MTTKDATSLIKPALVFILAFAVAVFLRMLYCQISYLNEAEKANETIEKIKAYERVILNHFPLSPYTKKAVNEMIRICQSLNDEKALYCYETLRSDIYQIRSFYTPHKNVLDKINPVIADLRARQIIDWQYNGLGIKDYERIMKAQMKLLSYEYVSQCWSAVVVVSLLGWTGSVIFIIFKGLGRPVNKHAIFIGFLSFLIFFTLWIIGLIKA